VQAARLSKAEDELATQIAYAGLPAPCREFTLIPGRKFRADFAWPLHGKYYLEVQGGGFVQGRHTRGVGLENDCEKFTLATLEGWKGIYVTPRQIKQGWALKWLETALS
jgi:hypothetical protein